MELRFVTRAEQNFFVGGGGIVSQEIDFGSCEYRCTRIPPGKRIALYYVYLPTSVSLCKHLHRYNLFFISSTNSVNAPFRSSFLFRNEYSEIFLSIFRLFRCMYLQIYLQLRNRQEFKKFAFTFVCICVRISLLFI